MFDLRVYEMPCTSAQNSLMHFAVNFKLSISILKRQIRLLKKGSEIRPVVIVFGSIFIFSENSSSANSNVEE